MNPCKNFFKLDFNLKMGFNHHSDLLFFKISLI